jgi:signal transduction histidine kinase/CheY-like chemotaxis protein
MSIWLKIIVVIVSAIALFSAVNAGVDLLFTQKHLKQLMKSDMTIVADIADELISKEIELLKSNAALAAHDLSGLSGAELVSELKNRLEIYPDFLAFTVFNRRGIEAYQGEEPVLINPVIPESVFSGESIVASTYWDETAKQYLIYAYVPIGNSRVFAASLSSEHYTDLLRDFKVLDNGDLSILDREGTVIASTLAESIGQRINYDETGQIHADKPVTGSDMGWRLAAAAVFKESPVALIQRVLLIAQGFFLLLGVVAFFVSDRLASHVKNIEEQNLHLAELNEKVKNASEAKSRFLANTSHEMRTPLNAIVGLSELMLKAGEIKGTNGEDLEKIHDAGMTLLAIVNDILDLSKVEAGKFELILTDYDVPSLINDAVTTNIIRKGTRAVELNLLVDVDLPSKLYGDELRVKQIINNLLSNAFKYTYEGKVTLSVMCEIIEKDVWLTIQVADEGIGIREEDISRLFSEYNQVDTKSNRKIEGTGLGLAITKKLVELMDGTISVESQYKKGSVFTVRIKQGFVTEKIIGSNVAEDLKNFCYSVKKRDDNAKFNRIPLPNARVLIVDDVENNLYVAKGMLKPYRMRVDCVRSGREAIERIRGESPRYNAIFMDHMMPELDGIETVRIIREEIGSDYAKNIPIIALTANAIIGSEKLFLENGFQAFLSKPINVKQLDAIIRRWVASSKEENIMGKICIRELLEDIGINVETCLPRFNGDWETILEVLSSFAISTLELLGELRVVRTDHLRDYSILLHGLKGSCRGICADNLGNFAEELEHAANAKDMGFIEMNGGNFIVEVEIFIERLLIALDAIDRENPKPHRAAPDAALLEKLSEYCCSFNMDGIDGVMAELDSYSYEKESEVIPWLRQRIERMEFSEIRKRLSFVTL